MGSTSSTDDSDDDDELPAKKCGTRRKRIAIPYDQQVMYDQQAMIGGVRNFPLACKQSNGGTLTARSRCTMEKGASEPPGSNCAPECRRHRLSRGMW
jgi:hypothetical protein